MRTLADYKQHLAQILGLQFDNDEVRQTVETVIEDVTNDYSEAQDYLGQAGTFGEDGVYKLNEVNDKDAEYWKNRYINSYLGKNNSGVMDKSAEKTEVTPLEDEVQTTMSLDQIIGKESV